jgi:hemoglobin
MRESHADMNITDTEFNALAEDLILAMEQNNVPTAAQNRLIKRLVPMYPDIRNL